MKKSKLLAVIITVVALICTFTLFASAEEPVQEGFVYDAEGGYYVFYDCGNIVTDREIWVEQYSATFRFDQEGRMLNEEWYLADDGSWYYYKAGGYRAESESLKLGGVYYAFNNEGVMVDGKDEEIYLIDKDQWVFVRAKAGGPIYVNEWYLDQDGTWYYYGENGYTTEGLMEYGGNYYYIGYRGEMYSDGVYSIYDDATEKWVWYRIKPNGVLYRNEWFENDYYYTDDCKAAQGFLVVDGIGRYFSEDGWKSRGGSYVDEAAGCTYVVNDNGVAAKLNANGWTLVGKDFYYCENGQMLTNGIYEIGNASYYFYGNGIMLQDNSVYDYDLEGQFRAGASGALYRNQWALSEEYGWGYEKWKYYGDDCKAYEDGIYTIGAAQYMFRNYIAVSDELVTPYDGGVYIASKSCALTVCGEGWFMFDDEWYYVENARLVKNCLKQIGEYKYGFDYEGQMYSDEYFEVEYYNDLGDNYEFNYYLASKSGAVVETPGWAIAGQYYYYVTEGGILYLGEMDVNGTVYYLHPQMNAASMDYIYEYDDDGETESIYLYAVLPNGAYQKVTASGYYSTPYGKLLVENGKVYKGWKQAGANWFYFDPELVAGKTIYVDEEAYYFDHSGKMAAGGWIDCGDTYKYADEYGHLADGLTTIGRIDYIFDGTDMVCNTLYFAEDGCWYFANASGKVTKLDKEGWNQIDDAWYYVQDGEPCRGEVTIVEDNEESVYLFDDYTCRLKTNYYDGYYFYDENGRRFDDGWVYHNGGWRYFDPNERWWGRYTIDDVDYFFEYGIMLANTTYYDFSNQTVYVIDANGVIVSEVNMADGFSYGNGNAWLLKNGIGYTGWYGDYYFRDGVMLINVTEKIDGKIYYFTPKGTYLRGWYKDGADEWIFANQNGEVAINQWIRSGSSWYYAGPYGWCLRNGIAYIEAEDKHALFDQNSVYVKYIDMDAQLPTGTANTWSYKDGFWYYFTSTGVAANSDYLHIGNSWYCFDELGRMYANKFDFNGFYYQASGARLEATCEWKLVNNKWLYFGANGNVESGWINLNGTKYYITEILNYSDSTGEEEFDYEMFTGFHIVGEKVYQFSAAGACIGEYTTHGWVQLYDGSFAYIKDGKLLTDGVYNINGTDYCFDYEGYMVVNNYYYIESTGKCVYASASGALLGTGWHNTENGWVYVDAQDGLLTNGVYLINNGLYFFNEGYWVS